MGSVKRLAKVILVPIALFLLPINMMYMAIHWAIKGDEEIFEDLWVDKVINW